MMGCSATNKFLLRGINKVVAYLILSYVVNTGIVLYASFPHTYILVCDPTVSDRKSIHSYVILRNVRFSSETPPLRKISVRYVRNIRSKNVTFAVVLRRYRMKVFMFFTKLVG